MEAFLIEPGGYCFGVKMALQKAMDAAKGGKAYCLGRLVHNEKTLESLSRHGVITIDEREIGLSEAIDHLPSGSTVVFSAHGHDPKLEEYVEIPSDKVPFEQRPWMKCAEIADRVIAEIEGGKWDFIKLNFPNGDMVGHTGVFEAVVCSMEGMDLQIGRIREAVEKAGGVMVITADHGNADDMYEHAKDGSVKKYEDGEPKAKTSHSLNPVPCIIYDPCYNGEYSTKLEEGLGISSIAATCMTLLGFVPPADYDKSVVTLA